MDKAKKINKIVCTTIFVICVVACYFAWSKHGSYTFYSFASSMLVHGGGAWVLYNLIDLFIDEYRKVEKQLEDENK